MKFVDELCTRMSFSLLFAGAQALPFLLGPSNGHTRGVLSISTSATLACRFLAWVISVLALFLFPPSLLLEWHSFTVQLELASRGDRHLVGVAMGLISVHWGLTLLILGSCLTSVEHTIASISL